MSAWLDQLRQDLSYALRTLRRSPGFTAVAVLTLAVGIGATTAIYTIVDAILLQPLPFTDSDRLLRVIENVPLPEPGRTFNRGVTYPEFLEWRARTRTLSDVAAVSSSIALVKTGEGTARLWGATVSPGAFPLLGARVMLGRTLVDADDSNPNVVLLGADTWRRLFQSDREIVGKTIQFLTSENEPTPMTIVGVLSPDFVFPVSEAEFFTPLVTSAAKARYTLIGRLHRDATLEGALQEANVIGPAITPAPPANAPAMSVHRFDIRTLKDLTVHELQRALRVFVAAVVVVLLIVCSNVATLLLARGTARQHEIAVRHAIGASRSRIARQILTECAVLATVGGALGAAVGAAGVALVRTLASVEAPGIFRLSLGASILPRINELNIDAKVIVVAVGAAGLASLIFGLLPAIRLSRPDHHLAMGPRGGSATRGAVRIRAGLVVCQLVMATTLLVAAGLLISSFGRLSSVNRGYDPANVIAFQLVFPPDYSIARKVETIESLLARLRATPAVEAAGFTRAGMLIGEQIIVGTFVPQGRTVEEMRAQPSRPSLRPVSPGYLTAMGVPVIEGRDLSEADLDPSLPSIIISRSVARQFGAGSQIGQIVDWHGVKGPAVPLRVVGVVEDLRNTSPARDPYPEVFFPYQALLALQQRWSETPLRQHESALGLLSFAVRARGEPAYTIPAVTKMVRTVDPNAGIDAIVPIERLVASSVARPRFYAVIVGTFAAVAGLLAVIGVYGLLAYAVMQRTQEIGIRMALGARQADVLALVLRQGLILTVGGVALGVAGAAASTRILQGMLFGVTPLDARTFAAVSLLFFVVTTFASYLPARRATRVDPIAALRSE